MVTVSLTSYKFKTSGPISINEQQTKLNPTHFEHGNWIYEVDKFNDHDFCIDIFENKKLQMSCIIAKATESQLLQTSKLQKNHLEKSMIIKGIWLEKNNNSLSLTPILYLAFRRARILNFENVIFIEPQSNITDLISLREVPNIGLNKQVYAEEINQAMNKLYQQSSPEYQSLMNQLFVNENLERLEIWLHKFYTGSWAKAIFDQSISEQQYIFSLYNMHQFVRYTTRLASRAVACCDDAKLRDHYLNHLKGEINHERIIERDLDYLGQDVDFVKYEQVPHHAIKEFMVVQESTIAFYNDPILMLANPFIAEGMTAHIQPEFMQALEASIASWGYKAPKQASSFLSSHIHTDGGEDGHWIEVVKRINEYVCNEVKQQQFASVMQAAMNGYIHGFNSSVDDNLLWSKI